MRPCVFGASDNLLRPEKTKSVARLRGLGERWTWLAWVGKPDHKGRAERNLIAQVRPRPFFFSPSFLAFSFSSRRQTN